MAKEFYDHWSELNKERFAQKAGILTQLEFKRSAGESVGLHDGGFTAMAGWNASAVAKQSDPQSDASGQSACPRFSHEELYTDWMFDRTKRFLTREFSVGDLIVLTVIGAIWIITPA